jgi:hypothetical protein
MGRQLSYLLIGTLSLVRRKQRSFPIVVARIVIMRLALTRLRIEIWSIVVDMACLTVGRQRCLTAEKIDLYTEKIKAGVVELEVPACSVLLVSGCGPQLICFSKSCTTRTMRVQAKYSTVGDASRDDKWIF